MFISSCKIRAEMKVLDDQSIDLSIIIINIFETFNHLPRNTAVCYGLKSEVKPICHGITKCTDLTFNKKLQSM